MLGKKQIVCCIACLSIINAESTDNLDLALVRQTNMSGIYCLLKNDIEESSPAVAIFQNRTPIPTVAVGSNITESINGTFGNWIKSWEQNNTSSHKFDFSIDERWEDYPQEKLTINDSLYLNTTHLLSFFVTYGSLLLKMGRNYLSINSNASFASDGTQVKVHQNNWNHFFISDGKVELNGKHISSDTSTDDLFLSANSSRNFLIHYKKIKYDYIYTNQRNSPLRISVKYSPCISVFVAQCADCVMDFELDCYGFRKTVSGKIGNFYKWQKVTIEQENMSNCELHVNNTSNTNNKTQHFWAMDKNIRICNSTSTRQIVSRDNISKSTNESCAIVPNNTTELLSTSTVMHPANCTNNTFGNHCSFKCPDYSNFCQNSLICDPIGCYLGYVSNLTATSGSRSISLSWSYEDNFMTNISYNISYKALHTRYCPGHRSDITHFKETFERSFEIKDAKPDTIYTIEVTPQNGFSQKRSNVTTEALGGTILDNEVSFIRNLQNTSSLLTDPPKFPSCKHLFGPLTAYRKSYTCISPWCKDDITRNITFFENVSVSGHFKPNPYSTYNIRLFALRDVNHEGAPVLNHNYSFSGFEKPLKRVHIANIDNASLSVDWTLPKFTTKQQSIHHKVVMNLTFENKSEEYFLAVFEHSNCTLQIDVLTRNIRIISLETVLQYKTISHTRCLIYSSDVSSVGKCSNSGYPNKYPQIAEVSSASSSMTWIFLCVLFVTLALLLWFFKNNILLILKPLRKYVSIRTRSIGGLLRNFQGCRFNNLISESTVEEFEEVELDRLNKKQIECSHGRDNLEDILLKKQKEESYASYNATKVYDLKNYITESLLLGNIIGENELARQFNECEMIYSFEHTEGDLPNNRKKNRYKKPNVYDHSRVKLRDRVEDYINANYIKGYNGQNSYIATQGPLPNTVEDFWLMVWQEKVSLIIMLTATAENLKHKCYEYWPQFQGDAMKVINLEVRFLSAVVQNCLITREFLLTRKNEKKKVIHLQYTGWPDHGVPADTRDLNIILRKMMEHEDSSPILVHCSAGWGRTGVIILCDFAIRMALDVDEVDLCGILEKIRKERSCLVNTEEQYVYAHMVVYDYLFGKDFSLTVDSKTIMSIAESTENASKFLSYLKDISWQDEVMKPCIQSISDENKKKIRFPHKCPGYMRIFLKRCPQDKFFNFIFAMKVENYRNLGAFLVTQQPLSTTIGDFWRLVDDQKVETIISLNELTHETSCVYWPSADIKMRTVNNIEITTTEENTRQGHLDVRVKLRKMETPDEPQNRMVELLHLKDWLPLAHAPKEMDDLLSIVELIIDHPSKFPILVACLDGSTASSLFISLYYIIKQLREENECDLVKVVRVVRRCIPGSFDSEDSILFLIEALSVAFKSKKISAAERQ